MERGRDFRSIINSVPFTFLVGPSHTKLTIQSGLAHHVSRPLDHLINSGQTRESKHQIAILEDEDVETFVAFCEYAYTGDYAVPPPGSREDDVEQDSINHALNGVYPDTGRTSPAAGLGKSPRRPTEAPSEAAAEASNGNDDRGKDVNRDEEQHRPSSRQSSHRDKQARYSSTKSEYMTQEQTVTPRDSDQSPTPSADFSPTRGRRRRRGKTDEQGFIQDATSKLTPPCTPPGAARVKDETNSAEEPGETPHAMTGADQSVPQSMKHPAPTSGNVADRSGYEGNMHQQEQSTARSRARPVIDTSFANQQFSPRHEKGTGLWDEFTGIDDIDFRFSTSRARSSNPLPGVTLPYLIFHAKLYVFATRYLIPGLAHLCLQKLHYDLLNLAFPDPDPDNQFEEQLVLTTTKARMIVNLLNYTYTKTTRLEPITPSSATQLRDNELRRLVVHYAACKVRDLAVYCPPIEPIAGSQFYAEQPSARGFRALLDTLPELASDLIYRMIQ
ncbi:uncharacterized protein DSM5745_05293 [Aspergillus mulundensis]|uniref:BTB domain-containing protein n=1 Tax=Aspergillus mulundensis TaxID=1810919 RepID=A0A3D8S654_9EURO|nr:Uncharacterized protein DSM5745_05293 [Aspergillus mulundensis]RDW81736.1 Uncharacterized protein DSM5745_05293 [Aspergillus mulundensis]